MRQLFIFACIAFSPGLVNAQGCCSGGSGSPLSGGATTGVLQKGQMEVAFTHQYSRSNNFFTGRADTTALFGNLTSNYLFFRADYGLSDKLTMSVASGYFLDKTLLELNMEHSTVSKGFGDLIILPRYSVFNKTSGLNTTELSLGLGLKIPIGSHNDSSLVFTSPVTGQEYYATAPPTVQTTNGSNDFMFYSFFFKGYPSRNLRLFASALYIKKGWNSLGQKFGDYASLGVFAGTTIFKKIGLTGQIKGEYIMKMSAHEDVNMLALYNIDMTSTGSRKLFFVPQISYTYKSLSIFALSEIPLYQHVEGVQVGSEYQFTAGLSYRFFVKEPEIDSVVFVESKTFVEEAGAIEEHTFKVWGNCDMCKNRIESMLEKTEGISEATWNVESKMLTVRFDNNKISLNKIQQKLADIGHDSEGYKASKKAYKKLHACCRYERS
ncbi:MAG: hypothetical protein GQ574_07870 [Crocinitomix sp.]|nr:hypothetical protein [Crocinitomix sp.]